MKVSDIIIPIKNFALPIESDSDFSINTFFSCDQDVFSIQDDLAGSAISPLIGVKNPEGKIIGYVERDTLNYLIKECSGKVFCQIADMFQEGVIVIDRDSRIFFVNDAYTKIIGVAKHNVLGKKLAEIEPGAAILSVLESGQSIVEKAVPIRTVNRYVVVNINPINDPDGQVVGAFSIFRDVTETKQLNRALNRAHGLAEYFRQQLNAQDEPLKKNIIGNHPSFTLAISQAFVVAKTDAPVLLTGENGVGKEVVAKIIHQRSNRCKKPLITVNCAAIPENLLESELFGYEGGAFTGANRGGKLGKFELAEGGTIFLDEIGDMPPLMQAKILRVLQEKEIEKIGRSHSVIVDVRILAATNRPLEQMVRLGQFRSDLYYRLNVVAIKIPALRERGEDSWLLSNFFLEKFNTKYNKTVILSSEVNRLLRNYDWPGNVRELQNCIEHAVIMCQEAEVRMEHLPIHMQTNSGSPETKNLKQLDISSLKEGRQLTEKELIEKAIAACNNNKTEAMKVLKISRRTFYKKIQKYNLI